MAAGLSAARATALAAHLIGKTADTMPTNVYLGALTSTGIGGAETTYASYARVAVPAASLSAAAVSGGVPQSVNSAQIIFPNPGSGSAVITTVALYTASSGGAPFAFADLTVSFTTNSTTPLGFDPGGLVFTLPETTGIAEYAALKLLDHLMGKTAWTLPATCTMDLLKTAWDGHTALSGYLATYTSYAAVAALGAVFNAPSAAEPSLVTLASDLTWPSNTGSNETENGWVLRDGSGNGLIYGTLPSQIVNVGIAPKMPSTTQVLSLG